LVGILIGFLLLGRIDDRHLRRVIAVIVIVLLGVGLRQEVAPRGNAGVPSTWWFAALAGILAGATTMLANAAGPVVMVYLLAMRLPKDEFLGTGAWFFAVLNWVKVPFSIGLGLISAQSLLFDAIPSQAVVVGAVLGIFAARRLPEKAFNLSMQALTFVSAVLVFF
jgi:hypothetical protein